MVIHPRKLPSLAVLAACASLVLLAAPVQAVEYGQLQPAASKLEFTFRQMGVGVTGHFKRLNAQIQFDPAKPEAGKASFEVDLTSIDAGSQEANAEVAGKDWFDFKSGTTARFVSSSVKPLGQDRYEVRGPLTLKGKSQEVVATLQFRQEAGKAQFIGSFPLKRLAYAVGAGAWGDTSIVADQVDVRFHLVATPTKK